MAYTTIPKPSAHFNTVTYTGNGSVGTSLTTGTFQPDFSWFKNRGTVENHVLIDAIRGASFNIASNLNRAETNVSDKVSAFTSTGVTLGSSAETNENNQPLVAWNWKGNGSGSANTDGTINSTVSANTTSGFSIVKYTGTQATATVGHGLGIAPKMIFFKNVDVADEWLVGGNAGDLNFTQYAYLNLTNAFSGNGAAFFNNTNPTSSVFSLGNSSNINKSGGAIMAYCFAEVKGYSKIGYYVGNQNADGPFLYTGFKPAFILSKKIDGASDWYIFDRKREGYNFDNDTLLANQTTAESSTDYLDILSNGYKVRTTDGDLNTNNGEYVYMAFAENPFVSTNGVPATAR